MEDRLTMLKKLSQQQNLFGESVDIAEAVEPEGDDRFSLDINWPDFFVPEDEVEVRESIIKKLLESEPAREKQSIIDEVIALRAGNLFETDIKKYLKRFPDLSADIPSSTGPKQLRLPEFDPAIRFMPTEEELSAEKDELKKYKEEGEERRRQLRELWKEKKDIPLSQWSEDYRLKDFAKEEGLEPLPEKINDRTMENLMKADITISQKKYNELESRLRGKYAEVKQKENKLKSLIESAKNSMPEEPPSPSLGSLKTIADYQDDLKRRIIFLSYNVIVNSSKWSLFGMPQPEFIRNDWASRSNINLFTNEDQTFLQNPDALGDYAESRPTLLSLQPEFGGWHSVPTPERYFNIKYNRLSKYEASLTRALASYEKGLRFLSRLDKSLTKALAKPLGGVSDNIVNFVEKEMSQDIMLAYMEIIGALYREADDVARERHYNHYGHKGAFNFDSYSRDEEDKEEKGLSLFDIESLFHNKIKFYEVIENFESLINVLINKPIRTFSKNYFAPAIKATVNPISQVIIRDIFGENVEALNDFAAISSYGRSRGGWRDPHLEQHSVLEKATIGGVNSSKAESYKIEDRDQKAQFIVNSWISAANKYGGSKDYNSVIAYPKFIVKEKGVAKNVSRDISIKLALSIVNIIDFGLNKQILSEVDEQVRSGKIKFKDSGQDINGDSKGIKESLYEDILNNVDKIKLPIIKNILSKNLLDEKISLDYSKRENFSKLMRRNDDYKNLSNLIYQGSESDIGWVNLAVPGYNKYIEDKSALDDSLSTMLADPSKGVTSASEVSGAFKRAISNFDRAYVKTLSSIFKMFHDWNLNEGQQGDSSGTEEIIAPYVGSEVLRDRESIRAVLEARLKAELGSSEEVSEEDSDMDPYRLLLNDLAKKPNKLKSIYQGVNLIDKSLFTELLRTLAGERSVDHRVDDNYSRYVNITNKLNSLLQYFEENIEPAKEQLDSLIRTAVYMNMFSERLNTFGSVGPRKIRRSIQDSKKKATREFGLTMFNPWIKQGLNNAEELIEKIQKDPWQPALSRHAGHIKDPVVNYWRNGGAEASGTYADKSSYLTIMLKKRFGITDDQELRRIYDVCEKIFNNNPGSRNYGVEDIKKLTPIVFDNMDNLESKLKKLIKISEFAHNNAANMPVSFYRKVLNDINFKNLGTNATVGKYFDMCTKLTRLGGLANIRRKYKGEIEALRLSGMLERGFIKTLRESYRSCREGTKISPNLEGLSLEDETLQRNIRNNLESVDTMLTAITEYSALSEYNERVIAKDPSLFNLNWNVPSKGFRFRVLKTFDPYHFRVGAATGCCQRLGGLGQPAAVDSYINPLAGVLVLDLKTNDGWKLASQSYFHYVPKDGSYILDNVEKNHNMAMRVYEITGYGSLEVLYGMLAKYAEKTLGVKYFLSGLGYSKINENSFGRKSLPADPRSFSVSKKYSDWKARSSLNLLDPEFGVPDIEGLIQKRRSKRVSRKKADRSRLQGLASWLAKNGFKKEAGFITKLKEDVSEEMAMQMEDLENKYFSQGYAQDYEDILDDMQQPGASGVIYTGDDKEVRGYLYGFEMDLEDQTGISYDDGDYDLRELSESLTCYTEECVNDSEYFLRKIISLANEGEIFYVSNFLVDKPHRRIVSDLIDMLIKEVKDRGYKYMSFNALSATHRLLMSEGSPSKRREERYGIKILCQLDMYAPFFIAEII